MYFTRKKPEEQTYPGFITIDGREVTVFAIILPRKMAPHVGYDAENDAYTYRPDTVTLYHLFDEQGNDITGEFDAGKAKAAILSAWRDSLRVGVEVAS